MNGRILVGRDREIQALDLALSGAMGGGSRVLMLSGEPGIGKTRLLEELAARVIDVGGVAAWGRMWEVGLTPSFWPWIQVLAALETASDRAPALGSLEQHTDAALRLARFSEVQSFLSRRAAATPIALLLDDLHAADPSSLQLLEYLLPGLTGRRVLFALAARDTDATPKIAAVLARIQRSTERLALGPLGPDAVHELVGDRADARRVFELSEGNPLFVTELLASQQSRGVLALPKLSSVRAVIRERVAGLPKATQELLRAAAIVGREFRGRVVAAIVQLQELGDGLEPALDLGMLTMTSPDRFRFSHALIAEAISDELGSPERARLHLQAAEALERHQAGDTSASAHHLLAAGHLAAEAAVIAAERAARECMAQLAFEDAAVLLERALGALALSAQEDRLRRASLLCSRAEALQHAAQHAAAIELCDEAAAIVRASSASESSATNATDRDAELFARIALVRGLEFRFGRSDPLLIEVLREALDRLGDRSTPLRAKLLARLAAAEQPARDPKGPVALAFEAIELAKGLRPRDRLDVMYVATAALVDYVEPEQIERVHHQVLALARGTDRTISVHTRLRLCFTLLDRVDRAAFDAAVEVFVAEAAALGLPQWTRYVHLLSALTALLEGRFEDDERATARFEAISASLGDAGAPFIIDVHRAMAAWVKTCPIKPEIRARLLSYVPGRAAIAAWLVAQDGDREATRAALAKLSEHVINDPELAAMAGAAVAFAGDPQRAAQTYATLESRGGSIVLASMVGAAVMDLYDRILLVLATKAGYWDELDGHAEQALGIAGKLGSPVWTAWVQADWADALDQRARADDSAHATSLRSQALATAERLGMPGLVARCSKGIANANAIRNDSRAAPKPSSGIKTQQDRVELSRQGELWWVSGFAETAHVKDSRGVQMIARLVAEPSIALHALDLAGGAEAVDGGDAGAFLDQEARAQYRARLSALALERDEAEALADRGRIERANQEIEILSAEIERAFGLGGRERRAGSASERARSNVQRRIAHGLDQIRSASPRLGEHLTATIRTGTYCVYRPVK